MPLFLKVLRASRDLKSAPLILPGHRLPFMQRGTGSNGSFMQNLSEFECRPARRQVLLLAVKMEGVDRLALQLQVVEELRFVLVQMIDHLQQAEAEVQGGRIPGGWCRF